MAAERVVFEDVSPFLARSLVRAYLSVIDVTNGTDVDMRLAALESGVCAVDVGEASGGLGVQGGLKGARVATLEAAARGPQERRD